MSIKYVVQTHDENIVVISLEGRMDASETGQVKTICREQIDAGRIHVIMNLHGISFMDSSGLSSLVSIFKSAREKSGTLMLVEVGAQTRVALQQTQLDKIFMIHDDVHAALLAARAR